MIKFFWGAIATVLAAFIIAALVPNTQADDNTSHTSVSTINNNNSNVSNDSQVSDTREQGAAIKAEEVSGQSQRVLPVGGPTEETGAGARPVEVKSTEPKVNTQDGQGVSRVTGESTEIRTPISVIKQTEDEHVKQGNGSMYAIDLTTSTGDVYFPKGHSEYVIYFVGEDSRLGNYVIIRHGNNRWLFGHTVTSRLPGSYVKVTATDNVLGQYNRSGISTGPHVHIERWDCPEKDSRMRACKNVSADGKVAERNAELIEQRGWGDKVTPGLGTKVVINDKKNVIACLNENNFTIHKARNTGATGCFLGNGGAWKNIMLPPQKDIDQFKKIFGEDYKYRLAVANFDGGFEETSENDFAKGYLQTLKKWEIPPDIVSQLNWLKTREEGNTGPACEKYLSENFTLFGTMNVPAGKLAKYTCMGRRHYGAFSPGDPKTKKHWEHSVVYAKRYKAVTEYYLSLNF